MRTTVTLDPDVAEQLKEIAHRRRQPFKVVLNTMVRAGLASERAAKAPYDFPTYDMGLRRGIDLTKAQALADALEDEELIRRMTEHEKAGK